MTSTTMTSAQPSRPPPPRTTGHVVSANGNGSLRPDKVRLGGPRRPTPDSEALASSDDDVDKHYQDPSRVGSSASRQPRRPSWLADGPVVPAAARKGSVAGAGSVSPLSSQPNSPSVDPSAWAANAGRSPATTSAFPWSNSIWTSDARKEPPARLAEVLPSPSSERSSVWAAGGHDETDSVTSDANIPFAIPLHPTPKSYRSQSYSVGQLDPDTNGHAPARSLLGPSLQARAASGQPPGLRNRPSRPSMLSELSRDSTSLDQVQEADDDDAAAAAAVAAAELRADDEEYPVGHGSRWAARHASDAGAFEPLGREKALLRQAAMASQLENARLRARALNAGTASGASNLPGPQRPPSHGQAHVIHESVPEESDYAVDEVDDLDELHAFAGRALNGRRFSEFGIDADGRFASLANPEHRKIESLKKAYWQSSLGFGGPADGPQSRRHSFADVPARSVSVTSSADLPFAAPTADPARAGRVEKASRLGEAVARPARVDQGEPPVRAHARLSPTRSGPATMEPVGAYAPPYPGSPLGAGGFIARTAALPTTAAMSAAALPPTYAAPSPYGSDRAQSPLGGLPRGAFGPPAHLAGHHSRQGQPLCVVTFKCCRADVFYLQEGTGLHVNVGDMVIVEADRGTDLGTVVNANVSWEQAKQLKEHYAEEHYKCLMMFSRHTVQPGHAPSRSANGVRAGHGAHGSAVGGMGPHGGHGGPEAGSSELRPKMIKRLAQSHEIQTLRDKEGNEAKAKRVCQQKVAEHRLQMEILDAEFQMDWKKLTFYYFADAYINFNSLVTELFKVYKTRIWMSAINPASFASVPPSLHPAAGVYGRQSPYRQQHELFYNGTAPLDAFQAPFVPSAETSPVEVNGTNGIPNPFTYAFQPFGPVQRPAVAAIDGHAYGIPRIPDRPVEFRAIEFGDLRSEHARRPVEHDAAVRREPHVIPHEPWMTSFQGLSLGTH